MSYEYKIGSTLVGMRLLTDLGITAPPHPSYRQFATAVVLGDGSLQGQGSPVVTWHWDVMKPGWSDTLANLLNGNLSATVYIRTRLNRLSSGDYSWATYQCIMRWITGDEDIQSRRSVGLTIEFTHLGVVT